MNAYNELYLHDAMLNLGDMVEYAVCDLGFEPDQFWGWFISSGLASQFEKGNPKYMAGMSGYELAEEVLRLTNVSYERKAPAHRAFKGREYWAGWILAYYQWKSCRRFEDMVRYGLSISVVMGPMYILHEADEEKFVSAADEIIRKNTLSQITNLQKIRKARGFTQQELSDASGVSLRMIQLYEQRQNDISKAQVGVVVRLARVLGCEVEDLIE